MEVGRRKKEEVVIAMVSAIKNVLTVLAVAIDSDLPLGGGGFMKLLVLGSYCW
jgi:hypothetical protein